MSNDVFEVSIVKYGTRQTVKSDVYLNFHIYQMPDATRSRWTTSSG